MMNRFGYLIIGLLLSLQVGAQARQVETYTVADGLAQSQVYALLADSRGYLWAGTQGGGLSRYDGRTFRTYSDRDGLAGNNVYALWEDQAGMLWVGTDRGLSVFDGRKFRTELTERTILSIDARETEIWVLTTGAIYHRSALDTMASWVVLDLPRRYLRPFSLVVEDSRLVLGTDQGAWMYQAGIWQQLPARYGAAHQVWSMYRHSRSDSWALAPGGQLFKVMADSLRPRKVPGRDPTVFYVSPAGDSWLGTQDQGVFVLPKGGDRWRQISTRDGLGSANVRAITGDRWSNIWVGTSGGGLSCLREAPFRAFDSDRGLPVGPVYDLVEEDTLGLFFSVTNHGLYRQTEDGVVTWIAGDELRHQRIKAIERDTAGRWWLGTPGNGIKLYTSAGWQQVNHCGRYVIDILEDGDNAYWVATAYEGLSRLTVTEDTVGLQLKCTTYGTEHNLPVGRIESLHRDGAGRLLIAYRDSGVANWLPDSLFWHVTRREGLPSQGVRAVRQDSTGYYWLATARGLVRVGVGEQGVDLKVFDHRAGLQSNNLYCLTFDQAGELWVGSERGVDQLRLDAAGNVSRAIAYGPAEGFTGIETCTNAALTDEDGNLWFGTMNGLMLHANRPVRQQQLPPPALGWSQVWINYELASNLLDGWDRLTKKSLQLQHDENQLSFALRAHELIPSDTLLYRWQLLGWDEQWSPPSEQGLVTYAQLPPGKYTFRAQAIGEGQRQSETLVLPIEIVPAWWQTTWFGITWRAGVLLVLGLLIGAWVRARLQRQARVAERLRLDNRLLELEHKALQLQMNPHFLANVLQGIQYEITLGAHERASQYLRKFGNLMRTTLYHARSGQVTLSDELDHLRQYLELEQLRSGNAFTFAFHVPEELEVDLIELPPMLLQPFLENAVHHAMPGLPGTGHIDMHVEEESLEQLKFIVLDNGPGLQASSENRDPEHRSTALQVIRERLALQQQKVPPFVMEERRDAQGQVSGVSVTVRVPIKG